MKSMKWISQQRVGTMALGNNIKEMTMNKTKKVINVIVKVIKWLTIIPQLLDFVDQFSKNNNLNEKQNGN